MKHIITDPDRVLIQPSEINSSVHFTDTFGNFETESTALIIVRRCQRVGAWTPMTQTEMNKLDMGSFYWNNLVPEGWVVEGDDGFYRVTHEFVLRCHEKYPVKMTGAEEEHANTRR